MPNKKQKQAMRAENKQRALAAKVAAESAADEFEEAQLREAGRQADLRGDPLVLPKLSVKTRKALRLSPRLKSKFRRGDVV